MVDFAPYPSLTRAVILLNNVPTGGAYQHQHQQGRGRRFDPDGRRRFLPCGGEKGDENAAQRGKHTHTQRERGGRREKAPLFLSKRL